MNTNVKLHVPVLEHPHWRVLFRPITFESERIPSIGKLWEIVNHNQVRIRGWDFPQTGRYEEQETGTTWIGCWSDFMGHFEYWRFYQSSQFIYLSSVREKTETRWDTKLREDFISHQKYLDSNQRDNIPGFFSVDNFIYTVTEFFEFAARLCQTGIYSEPVEITIELHNILGFILTSDWWKRPLRSLYRATQDDLGKTWKYEPSELIAQSNEASLNTIVWFFERFGWRDLRPEILRNDQESFLSGRL